MTLEQSIDFKEESNSLYNILKNRNDDVFELKTQFKSWSINDVLYHLHVWNNAAFLSLVDENKFSKFMKDFFIAIKNGHTARSYEKELCDKKSGQDLLIEWKKRYEKVSNEFLNADPKHRVKWAGPDMSVKIKYYSKAHGDLVTWTGNI